MNDGGSKSGRLTRGRQSLRTTRVRHRYRGNAVGSTLWLTLGSLPADQMAIACAGSDLASGSHSSGELTMPFNLDQNQHSGIHEHL